MELNDRLFLYSKIDRPFISGSGVSSKERGKS
jgi:hypothetical protein